MRVYNKSNAAYNKSNAQYTTEDANGNANAEQAARDAVMEIPAFPELLTRLTRVFGPGPERDMIHQLVYWFSKPKIQDRWTVYLTRKNWRDQRGLNRKQVDKGRARLEAHPSGVVKEKMGPYKRIHYRIDWVKLADVLGLEIPLKGYRWMTSTHLTTSTKRTFGPPLSGYQSLRTPL